MAQDAEDATADVTVDATEPIEAAAPLEASSGIDAAADVVVDAAPCSGVICNGTCLAASDCRGCDAGSLLCAPTGQCVSQCAGCTDNANAALPIECFACDSTHQNPLGSCQYDDASSYCLSGDYFGAYADAEPGYRCDCSEAGVSDCPGATQVCVPLGAATFCLTCGETTGATLQDQSCNGGGACQSQEHTCD